MIQDTENVTAEPASALETPDFAKIDRALGALGVVLERDPQFFDEQGVPRDVRTATLQSAGHLMAISELLVERLTEDEQHTPAYSGSMSNVATAYVESLAGGPGSLAGGLQYLARHLAFLKATCASEAVQEETGELVQLATGCLEAASLAVHIEGWQLGNGLDRLDAHHLKQLTVSLAEVTRLTMRAMTMPGMLNQRAPQVPHGFVWPPQAGLRFAFRVYRQTGAGMWEAEGGGFMPAKPKFKDKVREPEELASLIAHDLIEGAFEGLGVRAPAAGEVWMVRIWDRHEVGEVPDLEEVAPSFDWTIAVPEPEPGAAHAQAEAEAVESAAGSHQVQ